jgi:diguanylate cyclase (GGDEF)-like protein
MILQSIIASILSILLAVLYNKFSKEHEQVSFLASHDKLTGVYNRAYLDMIIPTLKWKNMSIIMFDIDHFKKINDTYGHKVGDMALVSFASIVKPLIGKKDVFVRWGGEEFFVITDKSKKLAVELAEKIRKQIEEESGKEDEVPHFTCTVGVVDIRETGSFTKQAFILADKRLYAGKANGRNIVVSEDE